MSRSRRKHAIRGITTARSEKWWKSALNRGLRKRVRTVARHVAVGHNFWHRDEWGQIDYDRTIAAAATHDRDTERLEVLPKDTRGGYGPKDGKWRMDLSRETDPRRRHKRLAK